ncbi:MAG: CPBP family intramembrane metalloprotease, partial [Ardenticatenia bacterium]
LFAGGTLVLLGFVAMMTVETARLLAITDEPLPFNPLLHPLETAFRLALLLLCAGLMLVSGLPREQFGVVPFNPMRDLAMAAFLGVVLAWVVNAFSMGLLPRLRPGLYAPTAMRLLRPRTRDEVAPVVLAALPAAALEEMLFRALLVGGFSLWAPAPLLVVLSSLLFGFLHMAQGVWGVLLTAALGMVMGWLFIATGSLWFVIVLHWALNANQLVLAYLRPDLFERFAHASAK